MRSSRDAESGIWYHLRGNGSARVSGSLWTMANGPGTARGASGGVKLPIRSSENNHGNKIGDPEFATVWHFVLFLSAALEVRPRNERLAWVSAQELASGSGFGPGICVWLAFRRTHLCLACVFASELQNLCNCRKFQSIPQGKRSARRTSGRPEPQSGSQGKVYIVKSIEIRPGHRIWPRLLLQNVRNCVDSTI